MDRIDVLGCLARAWNAVRLLARDYLHARSSDVRKFLNCRTGVGASIQHGISFGRVSFADLLVACRLEAVRLSARELPSIRSHDDERPTGYRSTIMISAWGCAARNRGSNLVKAVDSFFAGNMMLSKVRFPNMANPAAVSE